MHVAIIPGLLLFMVVFGHPAVQKEPATAHNGNLTYNTYSPAGPPEFKMTPTLQTSTQLDQSWCLNGAIDLVMFQALQADWNGRLPDRTKIWTHFGVQFIAQSTGAQNLETRFVFWATIRMMDSFVQQKSCNVTAADLTWRGEPVGRFSVIRHRSAPHGEALESPRTLSIPIDGTKLVDVAFFGRPNSVSELVMGMLAAFIAIAERVHGNRPAFVASWDNSPYTIYPIWFTTQRPSQLSKEKLIIAIYSAFQFQVQKDNTRCLKGKLVDRYGRYIAEGGLGVYPRHRVPGGSLDTA